MRSRDDFWRNLHICREYCASDRFVVPPLSDYFVEALTTIEAWCAGGRTPQYSERQHNRMGLVIHREITEAGVPLEGQWREMSARMIEVGNHFEYWPTDDQIRNEVAFWSAQTMLTAKAPSMDDVRDGAERIERAIRDANQWASTPIASERMNFQQPFAADTMTPVEWLQFVFLPRIRKIDAGGSTLPKSSTLTYLGSALAHERANWPIMYALSDFDHLFVEPELIDNVKRWPLVKRR
ncbi:YqcC family protein [Sandaracinus amylolyticus]|nr:YqcC family protein [Sandaracinus amylolyticus]